MPLPSATIACQERTSKALLSVAAAILIAAGMFFLWRARPHRAKPASVQDRLTQSGPAARARLDPGFRAAGLAYPPASVVLVAIKDRKLLQVWAASAAGRFALVKTYPILAASGHLGPKLREGDLQVPEGVYEIESLHPNSAYHLALRVNYPNDFDRRKAREEGRTRPGGDIMIHGSNGSVGCLAMGDEAAEDLFVLVAETGRENTQLIITPVDFRTTAMPPTEGLPSWADEVYGQIRAALRQLDATQ